MTPEAANRLGRGDPTPGNHQPATSRRPARPATTTTRASSRNRVGFGSEVYAPGINAFNALLAQWRDDGNLDGVILR